MSGPSYDKEANSDAKRHQTGAGSAANSLPSPAISLPFAANPLAAPASDHVNPLKKHKSFYVLQSRPLTGNKKQLKQTLRAVCSELRNLCTKMRTPGPSFSFSSLNGTDAPARLPAYATKARPSPLGLILGVFLIPSSLSAFETNQWSSSGNFELSKRSLTEVVWSQPSSDWSSMDAFELSAPSLGPRATPRIVIGQGSKLDQLFDVIASAEAGPKGYDAIHYSATRLPSKPPSQMTISEIFTWVRATPGQHHAIGRFQIIPSTLKYLVEAEGVSGSEIFSEGLQKRLAFRLMVDAGYHDFASGRMSMPRFQDKLARIWAGLPLANGRSAYHGTAGNRATITRANFDAAMQQIFGG